jgi:hypothetical protein
MKIEDKFEEDILKYHFRNEMSERAPEGFTDNVMAVVLKEAKPLVTVKKRMTWNLVPAISLAFTFTLIIAVLLLPSSGNDVISSTLLRLVQNSVRYPEWLDFDKLLNFSLPSILPYLFISILFLTIFDRGLNGVFHREK